MTSTAECETSTPSTFVAAVALRARDSKAILIARALLGVLEETIAVALKATPSNVTEMRA